MSRVAVVTGAASRIGLGVAQYLAADGHRVALLDRDGPAMARAAEATAVVGVQLDTSPRGSGSGRSM